VRAGQGRVFERIAVAVEEEHCVGILGADGEVAAAGARPQGGEASSGDGHDGDRTPPSDDDLLEAAGGQDVEGHEEHEPGVIEPGASLDGHLAEQARVGGRARMEERQAAKVSGAQEHARAAVDQILPDEPHGLSEPETTRAEEQEAKGAVPDERQRSVSPIRRGGASEADALRPKTEAVTLPSLSDAELSAPGSHTEPADPTSPALGASENVHSCHSGAGAGRSSGRRRPRSTQVGSV
jgi:hypothetical protein